MRIKLNDFVQYEVVSAKRVGNQIIATGADGAEITFGGDLSTLEVIDGELTMEEIEGAGTAANDLEKRVAAVESDVADLTAAVEKGLSL